jgi:hypothetical protein
VQNATLSAKPVKEVPPTVSPAISENISFRDNVRIATLSVALVLDPSPPIVSPAKTAGI